MTHPNAHIAMQGIRHDGQRLSTQTPKPVVWQFLRNVEPWLRGHLNTQQYAEAAYYYAYALMLVGAPAAQVEQFARSARALSMEHRMWFINIAASCLGIWIYREQRPKEGLELLRRCAVVFARSWRPTPQVYAHGMGIITRMQEQFN